MLKFSYMNNISKTLDPKLTLGEYCQYVECPNNCTHPNGECDHDTGICNCGPIYSPYNQSQVWSYWQGDDCSYLTPWCGCYNITVKYILLFVMIIFLGSLFLS